MSASNVSPTAEEDGRRSLYDSAFLERLERLSLEVRKTAAMSARGARRSRDKGPGLEFTEHRGYGPGDDLRHIDWNLYGRLGRLFVKQHQAEQEATVHLVLDRSASMRFGEPSKLELCARIAGALGYVALADLDRVVFASFADELGQRFGPLRGKRRGHALFRWIEQIEADGLTDPAASLTTLARSGRPGLTVVLSDLLVGDGWQEGLRALSAARFDVFVLQVLAPEDLNPSLEGDVTLVDSETGETLGLTVTEAVRARYRQALEAHCEEISSFCLERGIGYLRTTSDTRFEELVLHTLRRSPLLR